MTYRIYTMYVNRKDLLVAAIESLGKHAGRVVVLDNSRAQDLGACPRINLSIRLQIVNAPGCP